MRFATLAIPQLLVLDSATLGKVSLDFWSNEATKREKARIFLAKLTKYGVYVALTLTHICELLRHDDITVAENRLKFLRQLQLIAWLRPYNRAWFPGCITDLVIRELHSIVHCSASEWTDVVAKVRADLWETGTGSEMFVDNEQGWMAIARESKRQHENEKYIASVARTDPGGIYNMKIRELRTLSVRTRVERLEFMKRFAGTMRTQLEKHGDKRLHEPNSVALDFANETLEHIREIDVDGRDLLDQELQYRGVPPELICPDTTVGEIGELAVYVKQLGLLRQKLQPPASVTVMDVPPNRMPSHVIQRMLTTIQRKADRVSASDLGDGQIAPLALYADGVEVDKRTLEYLTQIRRADRNIGALMGRVFRSSDYSLIPDHLK